MEQDAPEEGKMEGAAMEQTEEAPGPPRENTRSLSSDVPSMQSDMNSPGPFTEENSLQQWVNTARSELSDYHSVSERSVDSPLSFKHPTSSPYERSRDFFEPVPPLAQSLSDERRPSYSYASMRTDKSMNFPPHFKENIPQHHRWTTERVEPSASTRQNVGRAESVSSVRSTRSDRSVEYPKMSPFKLNEGQTEVTCDMCSDHKAVKTCLTCNVSYCETDVRPHYSVPSLQRHKLVDVTGEVEAKLCQHYHRTLDLYCRTDQMMICSVCSETTHRGHDITINKASGEEQHQSWTSLDELPPPGNLNILPLKTDSINLSWEPPEGLQGPRQFRVAWHCDAGNKSLRVKDICEVEINELKLGRKYDFAVATEGENGISTWVTESYFTEIPPPKDVNIDHLDSISVTLRWTKDLGIDQIQQQFAILYGISGAESKMIFTESCCKTLSGLKPDTEYTISVSTVLPDGEQSQPVSKTITTRSCLMGLLTSAGLNNHYEDKLTLSSVLEINRNTTSDEPLDTMTSLPGAFLKKLLMASKDARSVRCVTSDQDTRIFYLDSDFPMEKESSNVNAINPLDLITALFLCSDGSLQQEMVQKMAMCQFAVPLLLPNCDTKQTTLMLWALREVVKKFKPSTSTTPCVEESIVVSDIPMVSFVSLGKDSLCKYQILNKMLSNAFVHRDMDCDDSPRKISDGLVEISWCLPCGNRTIDMFDKPVAVANLRGDIRSFDKQFSFLCQTSAAVYIFSDDYDGTLKALKGKNIKAMLFLVVNTHKQKDLFQGSIRGRPAFDNISSLKIIVKKKQHDAEFVNSMLSSVGKTLDNSPNSVSIENMAEVARHYGILVDEDSNECQRAKRMADEITSKITDTVKFKEEHLPLQGIWKEFSLIEKNKREAGYQEISSLKTEEEALRKKQQGFKMTKTMEHFIHALSGSSVERSYFLKWMQINLDDLSRQNLSVLREQHKDLCQNSPEKKEMIADLDKRISDCSLGLEHFLRELGQVYQFCKSEPSLSKNIPQMKQIEHLPLMYAQMLLDGLPIELVNGDTSDIPLKWVTDVLTCVHTLVKSNSKIKVVTVVGVQGTGKSTLLNTMFGVQFAVSVGRCTRGAFMQLIKVNKELREELKCDFIMIIDTEGLKAPELAQQNDSHEHDNELAALAVGLSDVTIINLTMEVFTEMKDLLKIVVSTFLGMKQVMKKPKCHFVHQNVMASTLVSADAFVRERKKMLEQLDEMTLEAAKMENKDNITKFTDIMEYDSDRGSCYLPGLWHGVPPMAPVSTGYSEAVYDLKKRLMQDFTKGQRSNDLTDFLKLIKGVRDSVKYENSFSFRNSLCAAYKGWERTFNTQIDSWMEKSEKEISDFDKTDLKSVQQDLWREANKVLEMAEKEILDRLEKYLGEQDSFGFVAKLREQFVTTAKQLRQDAEGKVRNTLQKAFESKEVDDGVYKIKSSQGYMLEKQILELLCQCGKKQSTSENALKQEFEKVWGKAVSEINFQKLPRRDIAQEVSVMLRENVSSQRNINCMTDGMALERCGRRPFVVESGSWLKRAYGLMKHGNQDYHKKKLQHSCDSIIAKCQAFITEKMEGERDYCDTYAQDLLRMIDKLLQQQRKVELSEETEVSLKQHICGIAATEFQKMHEDFIAKNDPQIFLERWKKNYFEDFMDLFLDRDQCQKKARDFVKLCLQPAVTDFVTNNTGSDIVEYISAGRKVNMQGAHQYSVLHQLLTNLDFETYKQYIHNYEWFVKNWLLDQLKGKLSKDPFLSKFEKKRLTDIVSVINTAISSARHSSSNAKDIKTFLQVLCNDLGESLDFPQHALDSIMILNMAYKGQFADDLTKYVREMEHWLSTEYNKRTGDVRERLRILLFKPRHQLFKRLFGCKEQCPFCKVPCEAGEEDHTEHYSSVHLPQGLSGIKASKMLVTDTCFSPKMQTSACSLTSESSQTNKDYRMRYLNWDLARCSNTEATDYWKYVMLTLNENIAKDCGALPAKIPDSWKLLTCKDAFGSLNTTFRVK